MICPSCVTEQPDWADKCADCGAPINVIRDYPRRVSATIWVCMIIGLGLLLMVFTEALDQVLAYHAPMMGLPQVAKLAAGIVFSVLGARAWATLKVAITHRMATRTR